MPPNSSILTDEDSGDEEEGGILDNLSGPQLASTVEMYFLITLESENL